MDPQAHQNNFTQRITGEEVRSTPRETINFCLYITLKETEQGKHVKKPLPMPSQVPATYG